jgi:hypothetical protein
MNYANMTREQLVALLAAQSQKGKKPTRECFCGCGNPTQSRFVPGHDARFHGWARKVAKGELDRDLVMATLPHDEAREEMAQCIEHMKPKLALEAQRRAERAAEKLAEESAKLRR